MQTVKFNPNNQGHKDGYPLFLGPDLGIIDTINTQYPVLEDLYQEQLSQIWNEFEVDLTQDKMDMRELSPEITSLMVKTIMWQTVADSVASRSIIETLGDHITNSEMLNLATLWSFFEVVHARTYSHIIKQTFTDPNEMLEELYAENEVMQRSAIIVGCFNDMANMPKDSTRRQLQVQIVKTVVALFALEAIAFMGSFAVTFAIAETGKFQGISQLVKLICRDEVLHTRFDYHIIHILKTDPDWAWVFEDHRDDLNAILHGVLDQEKDWANYLFSEGRGVVGINAPMLREYSDWMAAPVFKAVTGEVISAPSENPLPYMDRYIDPTKVQVAAQELQLTSYKIGTLIDDTDKLDLTEWINPCE